MILNHIIGIFHGWNHDRITNEFIMTFNSILMIVITIPDSRMNSGSINQHFTYIQNFNFIVYASRVFN